MKHLYGLSVVNANDAVVFYQLCKVFSFSALANIPTIAVKY